MFLNELFNIDGFRIAETILKFIPEFSRNNILPEPQVNYSFIFSVKDIIGFFLCKILSEIFLRIFWPGMALYGKIASVKGIKKVKTYGEIGTESIITIAKHIFPIL